MLFLQNWMAVRTFRDAVWNIFSLSKNFELFTCKAICFFISTKILALISCFVIERPSISQLFSKFKLINSFLQFYISTTIEIMFQ